MKPNKKNFAEVSGRTYATPSVTVLEVFSEGVLCVSEWYDRLSGGNFRYTIDFDNTWK